MAGGSDGGTNGTNGPTVACRMKKRPSPLLIQIISTEAWRKQAWLGPIRSSCFSSARTRTRSAVSPRIETKRKSGPWD